MCGKNSQAVFLSRHFIRESHLGFGQIDKYFSWADVRLCRYNHILSEERIFLLV
jgi:hypothetical protein